ncbi:MAG: HNH endonuclease [Candidatus Eisenbacteria bacterium]|uniref:HNH endonuclease n=1 Tax=Eiseniibacteriota bacterium TaxID=2212470 RepID=A0A849SD69_UNCEI|nr:HNH endonuclease [Candidatus Eisenbacteria bacterium]
MPSYSLSHLADRVLLRDLASLVATDRVTTAALLAHLAEVEVRQLYRPAAYSSMLAYCVGELRLSESAALRRIRAARIARKFPVLFPAIADGRIHLTTVLLLATHLTPESVEELVAVTTHKTREEVEQLLAERFPQPDLPTSLQAMGLPAPPMARVANEHTAEVALELLQNETLLAAPVAAAPVGRARVAPLSADRYALQVTLAKETHDQLRYAQALLNHAVPSGDLAQVLDRALKALVRQLEQRKFGAAARTCPRRGKPQGRYVPAPVRKTVWLRDGGHCTFVGENGRRCEERARLEFDHIEPVARGGTTTAANLRLRCRAHNQYEAEQLYGVAFMRDKREKSQRGAVRAKPAASATAGPRATAEPNTAAPTPDNDVIPWLRRLGFRAEEARRGAACCDAIPEASLEERVRRALTHLAPSCRRDGPQATRSPA